MLLNLDKVYDDIMHSSAYSNYCPIYLQRVETVCHFEGYLEEGEEMCLLLPELLKEQPLVQLEKQLVQTWTLR